MKNSSTKCIYIILCFIMTEKNMILNASSIDVTNKHTLEKKSWYDTFKNLFLKTEVKTPDTKPTAIATKEDQDIFIKESDTDHHKKLHHEASISNIENVDVTHPVETTKTLLLNPIHHDTHTTIDQSGHQVVTATPNYQFKLNFTTLFLKPSGDPDFACESYFLPALSPHWQVFDYTPNHTFAFNLGFETLFHTYDTNLISNWEHLRSTSNIAQRVDVQGDMLGAFSALGPDTQFFKSASGSTTFNFDQFNIRFGQSLQIGQRLKTNFFTGINYSKIQQITDRIFFGYNLADANQSTQQFTRTYKTPISFSGTGPEFGVDFMYQLHKGLQFVGQTTAGLLIGAIKSHVSFVTAGWGTTQALILKPQYPYNASTQEIIVPNLVTIVPLFTQKLGIAFEHNFRNHCAVNFEIGYQAQIFMNALQSVDMASEIDFTPGTVVAQVEGVYVKTIKREIHNFSMQGPYFKIDIGF